MATYNTQQKKELMDFLKKHPERAYTIDDIAAGMKSDPEFANPPGKSTIYRLMPGLAQENLVKCFSAGRGTKATYQIMGGESCHFHIHLKCTGYGKLLHMRDEASKAISGNLLHDSGFMLDMGRTILFGLCGSCCERTRCSSPSARWTASWAQCSRCANSRRF